MSREGTSDRRESRNERNKRKRRKTENTVADDEEPLDIEARDYCHNEAMQLFSSRLSLLISQDELLSDLPRDVKLDEINSQIALEYGQSMTITINKQDGTSYPVIVEQDATVLHLKKAVQRKTALQLQRVKRNVKISWKYIWKTYWLYFEGQKLRDDAKRLRDYGVINRSAVSFIKRLNE